MKRAVVFLFILLALANSPLLHSELPTAAYAPLGSRNVALIGQIGGSTAAVAVQGNYAYIGVGPRLVALDIANPAAPKKVGETALFPDVVWGVAVSGS